MGRGKTGTEKQTGVETTMHHGKVIDHRTRCRQGREICTRWRHSKSDMDGDNAEGVQSERG